VRNGQADCLEHPLGVVLVLRDLDRNRARVIRERCLNASEVAAKTELNQRVGVQATDGYPASPRFLHDRPCGRAESDALVEILQLAYARLGIERRSAERGAHDRDRIAHALEADVFLVIRDDDPPDAGVARRDHASKSHVAAGEILQLERNVLEDVGDVGAAAESLDEAARRTERAWVGRERRHGIEQAVVEAGRVDGRYGLERTEPDVARDDRREAPVVRTAKRADSRYAQLIGVDDEDRRRSGESGL